MNVRVVILALLLLPAQVSAQGFAGLGTTAEGFAVPQPDPVFVFPADHGPHPEFRIEWWYLTANLTDGAGTDYGLQWTLFRSALRPETGEGWQSPQLWMGHAAVTTPDTHLVSERLARGGIGQAGAKAEPFEAWIDDWQMAGVSDWSDLTLTASGPDFAYEMTLTENGPLVLNGADGYSVKSAEGQASYYYSQPFLDIRGTLTLPGGKVEVTGHAWIDREWSSQPLTESQEGWDWFSLSFETGARLMGFQLRQTDGSTYSTATWIEPDGTATTYPDGAFDAKPLGYTTVSDATLPTAWRVRLPDRGVDVTVSALNEQAWMATSIPYWEGPITVSGSHSGKGYLEMTGYDAK